MMYSQFKNIPPIPGTTLVRPQVLLVASFVLLLLSWGVYGQALLTSEALNLKDGGPPVGGDFVAFWGAAKAVVAGLKTDIYQMANFEEWLMETAMPRERFGLSWQYPPTYYFFVLPLAFVPFLVGFVLWSGGTMVLFVATLKRLFNLRLAGLFAIIASPVVFNGFITGQNGFLTAALLCVAAGLPDRRPLLAGLAAGLLTMKPQLGVLLPVAYIAGGYWRSFFTAAIVAVAMLVASIAAFGPETWQAFFDSVLHVTNGVQNNVYPIHKMPTVFAAFHKSGLPAQAAMALQCVSALGAMSLVFYVWRKVTAWDLRAAVLCAAVFLCSPYAYYYEMTILVLPMLVIVKRAMATGWWRGEELLLVVIWTVVLMLPSVPEFARAQAGLMIVAALLWGVLRRALAADKMARVQVSATQIHPARAV